MDKYTLDEAEKALSRARWSGPYVRAGKVLADHLRRNLSTVDDTELGLIALSVSAFCGNTLAKGSEDIGPIELSMILLGAATELTSLDRQGGPVA